MNLQNLHLKNFASFADSDLALTEGLWLVAGEIDGVREANNGAGKSALLEAPYWALTGSTVRGVRGGGVARLGSDNQCEVIVGLQHYQKVVDVARVWSPKLKALYCTLDNEDALSTHTAKEGTGELWPRLGLDKDLWLASTFFGRRFSMFSSIRPVERAALIERLSQASVWDECKKVTSERLKSLELDLVRKEQSIEYVLSDLSRLDLEESRCSETLRDEQTRQQEEMDAQKSKLVINISNIQSGKELSESTLRGLNDVLKELSDRRVGLVNIRKSEVLDELARFRHLEKQLSDLLGTGTCSICGAKSEVMRDEWKDRLEETRANISTLEAFDLEVVAELHVIDTSLKQESGARDKVLIDVQSLNSKLDAAQNELRDLEASPPVSARLVEHQTRLDVIRTSKIRKQAEAETLHSDLAELTSKSKALEFWKNGFQDIRFQSMDSVIQTWNELFLPELGSLSLVADTATIVVRGAKRQEVDVFIVRQKNELQLESLSDGELRRVDLALFLSFRQLVSELAGYELDMVVWDEPFDGLDEYGRELMWDRLISLGGQQFVIDHNQTFADRFENVLLVSKQDGVSSVVVER